jgi:hypothetical protein
LRVSLVGNGTRAEGSREGAVACLNVALPGSLSRAT